MSAFLPLATNERKSLEVRFVPTASMSAEPLPMPCSVMHLARARLSKTHHGAIQRSASPKPALIHIWRQHKRWSRPERRTSRYAKTLISILGLPSLTIRLNNTTFQHQSKVEFAELEE